MASKTLWEDFRFASLSPGARLLYLGLEALVDDMGNTSFDPTAIRAALYPYDKKSVEDKTLAGWMKTLSASPLVVLYTAMENPFVHLPLALKKAPRRILFPLAPGQKRPESKELEAVTVPVELKAAADLFVSAANALARGGAMTAHRLESTLRELVAIAREYDIPATVFGINEALGHDAVSVRYVRAVAKNYRSDVPLRVVNGDDNAPPNLMELRARRGPRKR